MRQQIMRGTLAAALLFVAAALWFIQLRPRSSARMPEVRSMELEEVSKLVLKDLKGNRVHLKELVREKPVVLDFGFLM